MLIADDGKRLAPVPRRVAILGMGPTLSDFIQLQLQNPGPGGVVDEVWGLNNVVAAVRCDMVFCMDDFVEMLERPFMGNKERGLPPAVFWDKSNPELMRFLRDGCQIPVMTSKAYRPRYPTSCEYPLDWVMKQVFGDKIGFNLSNSTSYAIAYAWAIGVKEIHLYGTDFAYPWHDPYDRRRFLEASRANVESLLLAGFMLGHFTFHMSGRTSLFDTEQGRPFYGYADGRKALTKEMLTTLDSDRIENDTRTVPGDSVVRSAETRGEALAAVNGGHAIQAAAPEGAGRGNGFDPAGASAVLPVDGSGAVAGPAG